MNATSGFQSGTTANSFYVNPIRGVSATGFTGVMMYDSSSKEIFYDNNATKTFVINHPTDENRWLVHACLEGPEAGVYYRGEGKVENDSHVEIELPNYVDQLATNLTVQVTHIYDGKVKVYSASRVVNNKFTVYGENGEFYWTVYGKRLSIEVEPHKNSVEVKGEGPYRWI